MVQDKVTFSTIIYCHSNRNLQEISKLSSNIWSFLLLHCKLEWKSIPANVIFRVYNGLEKNETSPKYGDMFNFLSFVRNLPVPLSSMVQGEFACTNIIYGAGKFPSPLSIVNDKTSEIEICLHHYHLWYRVNLLPTNNY